MLPFGSRALLALMLVLLPAGAHAQQMFTLTSVVVDVDVQATNGTDSSFSVKFTVTGTGIATATVTPQGGTAIPISPCTSGTSCSVTQPLSETEFNQLFPAAGRNFDLRLTQVSPGTGTITDTVLFTLPSVTPPAISFPKPDEPVPPGGIVVTFSPCAACNETTQAVLTQGTTQLAATPNPPATSTSWTPQLPEGQLEADSNFSVKVTHKTSGSLSPPPQYEPENVVYAFNFVVTHSDSVTFSTGSAPPMGTFCVVVNDPATAPFDTGDCDSITPITEPAAGILDTSGLYPTTAAGIPVEYTLQLAASGRLSGIAEADLDGDTTFETPTELVGRLKGKNGFLRQKIRMRFDPASDTKFKVRIAEEADLATLPPQGGPLEWLVEQKTSGKLNGAKLTESTTSTDTIDDAVTGWKLEFTLTGTGGPVTGELELAGPDPRVVSLAGKSRFDTASNQSKLELRSDGADRGVRIGLAKLVIDGTAITSGKLHFRAFGQSGNLLLPTTTTTTTTSTSTTTTTTTTSTTTTTM